MKPDAEVLAVAEVVGDGVGQISQGCADLRDAVLLQQPNGIFHQGLAHQSQHWLGTIACQGTQARALAACHDDRFQGCSHSFLCAGRSIKNTA